MKYKLVCFDMDGTLMDETNNIWATIFQGLGCSDEQRAYGIKMYEEGKFNYTKWAHYDMECWKKAGATKQKIVKALDVIRLVPGVIETLETLKKHGLKLAVISGVLSIAL